MSKVGENEVDDYGKDEDSDNSESTTQYYYEQDLIEARGGTVYVLSSDEEMPTIDIETFDDDDACEGGQFGVILERLL